MAYNYIATPSLSGSFSNIPMIPDNLTTPYDYLSLEQQSSYDTSTPLSISMTTYLPGEESPFRLTMLSPGFYLYSELSEAEMQSMVLTRTQHQHNTYEIVYVREGEFYQQIESRRYIYPARSCFLLNRNVRHQEEYLTGYSAVSISLSADFLKSLLAAEGNLLFPSNLLGLEENKELEQFFNDELGRQDLKRKSLVNFIPNFHNTDDADPIHDLLDQIAHLLIAPTPGSSYTVRAILCQLLYKLGDRRQYSTNPVRLGSETEDRIFSRISQLMEDTDGRTSRNELEQKLNYSGNYINRIVKKYTGRSIFGYGASITMKKAASLLSHTSLSVTEIVLELGFTDRTHFYRLFQKEYGMTPREYRRLHQAQI